MIDRTYEYDVFISYSHKDEDWVVYTLLPRLESSGARVCIDYRDFKPGKPSRFNMRDSIKASRFVALVMTPAWVASEWTSFESLLAFADDPAGQKQRTIPLLVENCDVPEDISILTYIDFSRKDRIENAWRQLLTATGVPLEIPRLEKKVSKKWNLVHPYGMPPHFTGREDERALLNRWVSNEDNAPLFVLRAIGGFGKSALAWYWLMNDVKSSNYPRVMWWSFYEGDASFNNFLDNALAYFILDKREIPSSFQEKAQLLINLLQEPGTLLILDGFERALRAFQGMSAAYQGDDEATKVMCGKPGDCVSPFSEFFLLNIAKLGGRIQSKVLITTRITPSILETGAPGQLPLTGWISKELGQMHPKDAVEFFEKQGIRGSRGEIETACNRYGYHPLSLRLLSGLILSDLIQPGDIAVSRRLDISGNIRHHQHHVLEQAYITLSNSQKRLLGQIACFRSAVPYEALKTLNFLDKLSTSEFDSDIAGLISRGLLHRSEPSQIYHNSFPLFDLHPIVRRFVYDHVTSSDRDLTHARLIDYFESVPKPQKVNELEDLNPLIELFHHTVRAKKWMIAFTLYSERLNTPLYFQFGAYQLIIDLLGALKENWSVTEHNSEILRWLANAHNCAGQPQQAVDILEEALESNQDQMMKIYLLQNLSTTQIGLGLLQDAESNVRTSIILSSGSHKLREAVGHLELGRILAYRGKWTNAEQELDIAWSMFEQQKIAQALSVASSYYCLLALLMIQERLQPALAKIALNKSQTALNMAKEYATAKRPVERDFIDFHWLLGASLRINGKLKESESHLKESLSRCRAINLAEREADILLELARLNQEQNKYDETVRLIKDALMLSERSGYVLQSADSYLLLSEIMLKVSPKDADALAYAQKAKDLSLCQGGDYIYQVVYERANELFAQFKGRLN